MCPSPCKSMDCSPSDSSVHEILQARLLEGVAIPISNTFVLLEKTGWYTLLSGYNPNYLITFLDCYNLNVLDLTYSTQKGKSGNIEYLALISKNNLNKKAYNVKQITEEAFKVL